MSRANERFLPTGKLRPEFLAGLLELFGCGDSAVVQGSAVGVDVAILDLGGPQLLAAKTDPITFATDAIGYYAVVVNSNDIATCGGRPRWMLTTALLPEKAANEDLAADIFHQLADACDRFDITHVGGHTEVTYGLDRPILVATMLGLVDRGRYITSAGARAGDVILLTKAVAVEGTSLLARELGQTLLDRGFDETFVARCAAMLYEPGISVLREAQVAVETGKDSVHAMHDPTEGGLTMGLWELALAARKRVFVDVARIPVLEECRRLCDVFGLDPLGLIASGSLLITVAPEVAGRVAKAIEDAEVPCAPIGEVQEGPAEALAQTADGELVPLPRYDQDELTKVL
ncbi:MAG: AIR synthase family protein [Armatimonadota bacterium]